MRKILSNDAEHPRVFAHILDNGTIDIVRQEQRFTIIGTEYTVIGTNPQGGGKTVLVVKNGKLLEDGVIFKKEPKTDEEEPKTSDPAIKED